MADKTKDNKMLILNILKKSKKPVSGEELGKIASISRVSVWKHIKSLKEHGYEIDSAKSGYFLKKEKDLLQKWEFPQYKNRIKVYLEIDSTMRKARAAAHKGAESRTIIAAEKQTEGIDSKGKKWESKAGGLYFTIILRPNLALSCFNLLTLGAAAGITQYLKSLDIESSCRWPNSVVIDKKKISGILTEVSGTSEKIDYALVGIGFNINNISSGISLKEILKKDLPRQQVLNSLLEHIFRIYDSEMHNIPKLWNSFVNIKNRNMQFKIKNKIVKGSIKELTRDGNLLIKTSNGNTEIIIPGDEVI